MKNILLFLLLILVKNYIFSFENIIYKDGILFLMNSYQIVHAQLNNDILIEFIKYQQLESEINSTSKYIFDAESIFPNKTNYLYKYYEHVTLQYLQLTKEQITSVESARSLIDIDDHKFMIKVGGIISYDSNSESHAYEIIKISESEGIKTFTLMKLERKDGIRDSLLKQYNEKLINPINFFKNYQHVILYLLSDRRQVREIIIHSNDKYRQNIINLTNNIEDLSEDNIGMKYFISKKENKDEIYAWYLSLKDKKLFAKTSYNIKLMRRTSVNSTILMLDKSPTKAYKFIYDYNPLRSNSIEYMWPDINDTIIHCEIYKDQYLLLLMENYIDNSRKLYRMRINDINNIIVEEIKLNQNVGKITNYTINKNFIYIVTDKNYIIVYNIDNNKKYYYYYKSTLNTIILIDENKIENNEHLDMIHMHFAEYNFVSVVNARNFLFTVNRDSNEVFKSEDNGAQWKKIKFHDYKLSSVTYVQGHLLFLSKSAKEIIDNENYLMDTDKNTTIPLNEYREYDINYIFNVMYGNYMIIGSNSLKVFATLDKNLTQLELDIKNINLLGGAANDQIHVIVGSNNFVEVSTASNEQIIYAPVPNNSGHTYSIKGVAIDSKNQSIYVVGNHRSIWRINYHLKDGVLTLDPEWMSLSFKSGGQYLYSIAINQKHQFVAVGVTGTILYSDDGIKWIYYKDIDATNFDLNSVIIGDNNRFIIVGDNNTILYSDNINEKWKQAKIEGTDDFTQPQLVH